MRIFELDRVDPLATALVAVADQLHYDLDSGEVSKDMSLDQFLEYLRKYDIALDNQDLYKMIKRPPLNDLIANIKGDRIIFKGFPDPIKPDVSQQQKIVKQMANRAIK